MAPRRAGAEAVGCQSDFGVLVLKQILKKKYIWTYLGKGRFCNLVKYCQKFVFKSEGRGLDMIEEN